MSKQQVTLLVDSDILAFKTSCVHQMEHKWDEEVTTISTDLKAAKVHTVSLLNKYIKILNADHIMICLTDRDNFRTKVLPSYKGNRKGVVKPQLLTDVKQFLINNFESYIRPGLEADDVMGILSTHPKLLHGKKIIVSEDKDMQTIPGWLFNPNKDTKERLISKQQADRYHLLQTLTGDATDGYKGCPGIGPKKAEVILDAEGDTWENIISSYEAKGLTGEDALVQARVACICRHINYDFKKKEVILWNP